MGICSSSQTGAAASAEERPTQPKVVLIHGMASCALDSLVDDVTCGGCIFPRDGFGCAMPCTYERGHWDQTWINVEEAVTGFQRLVNILQLQPMDLKLLDGTVSRSMVCPKGVQVRPYEGVPGISSLNPKEAIPITVWKGLTDELERLGWDMIALNYDWRRWGDRAFVEDYVATFRARVEAEVGDGPPVPIIGHSMGCTVTTYCLGVLGSAWAARHVSKIILVGLVVQGSPKVTAAFGHTPITVVANLPFTMPPAIEGIVNETLPTWPCMVATFPQKVCGVVAFPEDDPLVVCPTKKYTAADMGSLLEDMAKTVRRAENGPRMWKSWAAISPGITPPCVETHVIYGKGFDTCTQVTFPDDDFSGQPKMTRYEDGDDTVPAASTEAVCDAWKKQAPSIDVHLHPQQVDHQKLIQGPQSVELIPKLLLRQ